MEFVHNLITGETVEQEGQPIDPNERLAFGWALLRAERNALLSGCDWTVLSDTPTVTAAWKVYRQALRDLPANTTDPFNPVWPTPPA